MIEILKRSFGGISLSYYLEQLAFGLAASGFLFYLSLNGQQSFNLLTVPFWGVNALLYPYSRLIHAKVVEYFLWNEVAFVNDFFSVFLKLITIIFCWMLAPLLAPIGLLYLYRRDRKDVR